MQQVHKQMKMILIFPIKQILIQARHLILLKNTHIKWNGDNGVIVTNQYLVREFRELAVSIDEQIIQDLNILFMGLF